ncbi:MAG: ATP-binding cassette domain-containing protein [Bryobacteraceae bacterium]|nr:ATP-binding cassette domain-containing protein [Bryobacteraceae bacterium]
MPPAAAQGIGFTPEPVVEVENVVFCYDGTEVLHDISFTLNKADVAGLLGLNGAGKSTALKLLTGILAPLAGRIAVMGSRCRNGPPMQNSTSATFPSLPLRQPYRAGVSGTVGPLARRMRKRRYRRGSVRSWSVRSYIRSRRPPGHLLERHAAEVALQYFFLFRSPAIAAQAAAAMGAAAWFLTRRKSRRF